MHDYESGLWNMTELCAHFEMSRQTAYKWLARFREDGIKGLEDRSRAPRRHPNQTPEEIEKRLVQARGAHPSWGARKVRGWLQRNEPGLDWPAASTIGALLRREGLTVARKKRRKTPPYTRPFEAAGSPNLVWCADFKGWFRTKDGERIDPLTMTDAYSRYLLRCQAVEKTDTEQVQGIFQAAFREFGMPRAMHTDNGAPFASRAIAGLSRLSVWLMKLGIIPERIEPGHPEQNGRHERMHRVLKAETAHPPAANRRRQQQLFDRFREEYNEQRPHEALGQQPPASIYTTSPRSYPARLAAPEYPRAA